MSELRACPKNKYDWFIQNTLRTDGWMDGKS